MDSRRALVIRGHGPVYKHTADVVDIPVEHSSESNIALRRDLLVTSAPHEVFACEKDLADYALLLWDEPQVSPHAGIITTHLGQESVASFAELLLFGGAQDPRWAWLRFLAATHRWACECDVHLRKQGKNRETRRDHHKWMRRKIRRAISTLPT